MNKPEQIQECKRIKSLIEKLSGINNIGIKSKKNDIPDLKKIYCKLSRVQTNAPYSIIGSILRANYNHASVLYSIRKFDELYNNKQLNGADVYGQAVYYLNNYHPIARDRALLNDFLQWVFDEKANIKMDLNVCDFVDIYLKIKTSKQ